MYLGIDIGGTKTLVAALDDNGVIIESQKFPTPKDYLDFLSNLSETVDMFTTKDFWAVGVGIPATKINRQQGIAYNFSHLPWHSVPIQADIEKLIGSPVAIENDAKLAGLSEWMLRQEIKNLLYVTISTGIGYGLIVDGKIDPNIGDSGGTLLLLEHQGALVPWENFASGRAIVETYNQQAHDITDPIIWSKIAKNISQGLIELIAVCEPDIIVIGGSVGTYFDRYGELLNQELQQYQTPLLTLPPVEQAKRPEEAVVYGCFDYAKQCFPKKP